MPRPRTRACLQQGPSINLAALMRRGPIKRNSVSGATCQDWPGLGCTKIAADMRNPAAAWLYIQAGKFRQRIELIAEPRPLGGVQWYFKCPRTRRLAIVLYMPPGGRSFASRHAWGSQAAYASQFECNVSRAERTQRKIKARLIADCDPADWDLPPKPKWMRWPTYRRMVTKYDECQDIILPAIERRICRILGKPPRSCTAG